MSKIPDKFTIPKDRIPREFAQGPYRDCVAITLTKILEVYNYIRTGEYIFLSKGYMYGRNNRPGKTQGGSDYEYMLNTLLKRGTVPEELCPERDEIPEIVKKLEKRADIKELDKLAEDYKIDSWEKIPGNAYKLDNIKKCLYEHQMPIAGNMTGNMQHCTVIVGYDGDKLIYQDHDASGRLISIKHTKFNAAYFLNAECKAHNDESTSQSTELVAPSKADTAEEIKEESDMGFKLMDVSEFKSYIDGLIVKRNIKVVQLHHTALPAYKDFNGANHIKLQEGMKNYHTKTRNYDDIAQQFTIFPDGKICTGRDINEAPAGIYGANSTGVCVECLGNFDKGGDSMTDAQKNAIIAVTRILLDKFGLNAKTGVTYHAWWTSGGSALGTYIAGRSYKTCPGTNFFGGNTREAYEKNLLPLIEAYGKVDTTPMLETPNDITWELNHNYFPIDDMAGFIKVLTEAQKKNSPLYWGYYKLVNRIK